MADESQSSFQHPEEDEVPVKAHIQSPLPESKEEREWLFRDSINKAKLAGNPAEANIFWETAARINSDAANLEKIQDIAGRLYREGTNLYNQGKSAEAIVKLEAAIKLTPEGKEMPFAYARMGQALSVQKRYEEAQPFFERAVSVPYLENQTLQYEVLLAANLAQLGRHAEAVEKFEKILLESERQAKASADPNNASVISQDDIFNRLGVSLSYLGRHEEAASAFINANYLNPQNPEYRKNIQPFLPLVKKMSERVQAQEYSAIAQEMLKEFNGHHADGLLSLVKESISLDPDNEISKKLLELIQQAAEKPAQSTDKPEEIAILARAFNNAGNHIVQNYGDFDAVCGLWEKALSLKSDDVSIRYNMAISCYDREEYADADRHIDIALQGLYADLARDDGKDKTDLKKFIDESEKISAIVQSRLGRHEAVILLLQDKFSGNAQRGASVYHAYGVSLAALGRKEEAVRFLEFAVDSEPTRGYQDDYRKSLKNITGSDMTAHDKLMQKIREHLPPGAGGPSMMA